MASSSAAEVEDRSGSSGTAARLPLQPAVGISIRDAANQHSVESAAVQLGLLPFPLTEDWLNLDSLSALEVIVADESVARNILAILAAREERGSRLDPAIIATLDIDPSDPNPFERIDLFNPDFDGLLALPQAPIPLAAQLASILWSHRSFARRYQPAMEELQLNRSIFRSVTSGISVADATLPDLPLIYVNPAFEKMTGYCIAEIQGQNCRFLQANERDQPALAIVRDAIRDERDSVTVLKNFRKDGTPFWNELHMSPIHNREGRLTHFVGIQTNITLRVEFEAALRESEKLAAVGRLASSIAHEINNPLESVMNLLYLAERTDCPPETRQYLRTADEELKRVKHIASQSLRFCKQSTRPQSIGCTELLTSLLDLYHSRLQNSAVSVSTRQRSRQPILCMESEIRHVLNNLVSNAIDAMHGRGGRLLIRTRDATDWRSGALGVVLTIADTGSGMSPSTMKNIYRAFFTTKGIGGTGLGLWTSSEIVGRHEGRLVVRSSQQPGRTGTVFQLFLPLKSLAS